MGLGYQIIPRTHCLPIWQAKDGQDEPENISYVVMWNFLRHTGVSGLANFLYGIIWEIGMFFLNISIIIADINTVQTTLCSEISPLYFDLFFKIFCQNKCRLLRDNRHCPFLYKTDSKFFGNQCVYRCLKWSH